MEQALHDATLEKNELLSQIIRLKENAKESEEKAGRVEREGKKIKERCQLLEAQMAIVKQEFDRDTEIQHMKILLNSAREEVSILKETLRKEQKDAQALQEMNSQMKRMNVKYFSALRSLQESEQKLLAKERQIREISEKNSDLQRKLMAAFGNPNHSAALRSEILELANSNSPLLSPKIQEATSAITTAGIVFDD